MRDEQLAEIDARLRAATPGPWTKDHCGGGVVRGSTLIEFVVVTGYKDNGPNDPIEVYALDECPECAGQKIGSHVEESTARVLEDCR